MYTIHTDFCMEIEDWFSLCKQWMLFSVPLQKYVQCKPHACVCSACVTFIDWALCWSAINLSCWLVSPILCVTFQIFRPPQTDIDVVNARFRNGDPVYKHPMMPGFEGTFLLKPTYVEGRIYLHHRTLRVRTYEHQNSRRRHVLSNTKIVGEGTCLLINK